MRDCDIRSELNGYGLQDYYINARLAQGYSLEQLYSDIEINKIDQDMHNAEYWKSCEEEANENKVAELIEANRHRIKTAADFGEDTTTFVWNPFIPVGEYTVMMAGGGTGKTICACLIAAHITTGKAFYGEYKNNDPQNVLFISAEDRGELLKKRLQACGADLSRVFIIDCKDSEDMNFTEKYLEFQSVIQACNPALVFIDPWHAFLGADTDINRVNAVRPVFQKLANMAKNCKCGLVLISHVNKRAQSENVNNAATGSSDFINAARSAFTIIFDDDPAEENTRIIVHTKTNYAALGTSVKYEINDKGGAKFTGFSNITRSTLEDAARFKKRPSEVLQDSAETTMRQHNEPLIEAIKEKAIAGKTVNISFDQIRDEYGEYIFNGEPRPSKAIKAISEALSFYGISVETGKTVRYQDKTRNGFAINMEINEEPF